MWGRTNSTSRNIYDGQNPTSLPSSCLENIFYFQPAHTILGTGTIFQVHSHLRPHLMLPLPSLQDNSSHNSLVHKGDRLHELNRFSIRHRFDPNSIFKLTSHLLIHFLPWPALFPWNVSRMWQILDTAGLTKFIEKLTRKNIQYISTFSKWGWGSNISISN